MGVYDKKYRIVFNKFIIVFLWSFFFFFYLPDVLRYFNKFVQVYFSLSIPNVIWICWKYVWLVENSIVFLGHRFPMVDVDGQRDTRFTDQAFFASIILSAIFAGLALIIDRKYHFLVKFRAASFPVFYVLIARFTSLIMIIFGLDKVFTNQFEDVHESFDLMTPLSAIAPGTLVWAGYGISDSYEIILGMLELIGAILLWIPRTVVPGAVLEAIVLTNILLMDFFIGVDLFIIVVLLLAGVLFLLAPEMPHYFRHFLRGTIHAHLTPVYSLGPRKKSPKQRALFRSISLVILVGYTSLIVNREYILHSVYRDSYADPMHGVWDTPIDARFGKYRLGTLGVDRMDFSHIFIRKPLIYIAIFPMDKSAPPDMKMGKNVKNSPSTIEFSLSNDKGKETKFTLHLEQANTMILRFMQNNIPSIVQYHRRTILLHIWPRTVFDDYPKNKKSFPQG